jgi:hypothetical protein
VPAALETFLTSGAAAALILAFVALEALPLFLRWRAGRGSPPAAWLSQLLAGACLVGALLAEQRDAAAPVLGSLLFLAGCAHLGGYRQRWRAARAPGPPPQKVSN